MPLIDKAIAALNVAPERYRHVHELIYGLPGVQHGSGSRAGKPSSKPPSGSDRDLRAALVTSARRIVDVVDAWGHHGAPARPVGFPNIGSAWWTAETRSAVTEDGETITPTVKRVWAPDPDDLLMRPPTPGRFADECARVSAYADWVATLDVPGRDPHVRRGCRMALQVAGVLRRTVAGEDPLERFGPRNPASPADRCRNFPHCTSLREPDDARCRDCRRLSVVRPDELCVEKCGRLRDGRNRTCRTCRRDKVA